MADNIPRLTILIPFHHEEDNISAVLTKISEVLTVDHEIILIHEDANDPTLPVVENVQKTTPSIKILLNRYNRGIPGSLKTGIGEACGQYIVFLVADDEGAVLSLPSMLAMMEQGYDLVTASRYIKGGSGQGGKALDRISSSSANWTFRFLTASRLSDTSCGIKMFRKSILEKIYLKADKDWTIAFELAVEAQYYDFKVIEVPFVSYNRLKGGQSHFKMMPRFINYGKIFLWGVGRLWKKKLHV